MLRISSRCLVAFNPSSEIRVLNRSVFIGHCHFEIEIQFHFKHSPPIVNLEIDLALLSVKIF